MRHLGPHFSLSPKSPVRNLGKIGLILMVSLSVKEGSLTDSLPPDLLDILVPSSTAAPPPFTPVSSPAMPSSVHQPPLILFMFLGLSKCFSHLTVTKPCLSRKSLRRAAHWSTASLRAPWLTWSSSHHYYNHDVVCCCFGFLACWLLYLEWYFVRSKSMLALTLQCLEEPLMPIPGQWMMESHVHQKPLLTTLKKNH